MKELIIFGIAGLGSLVILGYSVHMFVGGLVDPMVEKSLIAVACTIGAAVIGFMAWDVIKRRRGDR